MGSADEENTMEDYGMQYWNQGVVTGLLALALVASLAFLFVKGLEMDELRMAPSGRLGGVKKRHARGRDHQRAA